MPIPAHKVLASKPHKVEPFLYIQYCNIHIIQYRLHKFFIDSDIINGFSPLIRSQEDCLTKSKEE
jgi:hypothetical protein